MKLIDLLQRGTPQPWTEGDNIPWNDPEFSQRMLFFHLSQDMDAASRRSVIIDQHVRFIHNRVLGGQPSRILDLACGPGLYAHRLARLGHTVYGIDFSPASIDYARQTAEREGLPADCTGSEDYQLADLRRADFGPDGSYDLVMMIFGEFNVFSPPDARAILRKAHAALKPGGKLLLEPSPEAGVRKMSSRPATWSAQPEGLFCAAPHMLLEESFWDEPRKAGTRRFYVVDLATHEVTRHAASYQAYSDNEYRALLEEHGFHRVQFFPNLRGEDPPAQTSSGGPVDEDMIVLLCER